VSPLLWVVAERPIVCSRISALGCQPTCVESDRNR
jgi:hypothetical protein